MYRYCCMLQLYMSYMSGINKLMSLISLGGTQSVFH